MHVNSSMRWPGPAITRALLLASAVTVAATIVLSALLPQIDIAVYRMGGSAMLHAENLYGLQTRARHLPFTYPPFAALIFVPLGLIPAALGRALWCVVSLGGLTVVISQSFGRVRPAWSRRQRLQATGMVLLPCMLLEPIRNNLILGQVNLVLVALIMIDLAPGPPRRSRGALVGVAAAMKLTPLIFVFYLALARRGRDAAVAAVTFAGCIALGFVADPSASRLYWTRLAWDPTRTGHLYFTSNQSLYAAMTRITHGMALSSYTYRLTAIAILIVGLATAVRARRAGDALLGDVTCGITGLVVSPVSWTHHWVWVVPALAWLVAAPGRPHRGRAAAGLVAVIAIAAPVWWVPHTGDAEVHQSGWELIAGNTYLLLGLAFLTTAVLVTTGAYLRGDRARARATRMTGG